MRIGGAARDYSARCARRCAIIAPASATAPSRVARSPYNRRCECDAFAIVHARRRALRRDRWSRSPSPRRVATLPVLAVVARGIAPDAGADLDAPRADGRCPRYVAQHARARRCSSARASASAAPRPAWLVAHRRFPGAAFFDWALLLPLAMPAYVMAYAYTDFLQYAGPLQTALRDAFGWSRGDYWFPDVRTLPAAPRRCSSFSLYPYVYLLARTAFLERPRGARRGGAHARASTARSVFWRVELPLARPAIAGGIALALMETLADYGTVAYFAVDTFTTGIYRAWFSLGDRAAAAQLADAAARLRRRRPSRSSALARRGAQRRQAAARAWCVADANRRCAARGAALRRRSCARFRSRSASSCRSLLLRAPAPGRARVPTVARFVDWSWNSLRVAAHGGRARGRGRRCWSRTRRAWRPARSTRTRSRC